KMFQWFLNQDMLEGFISIPRSRLENADRQDTVDKMVETYGPEGAVKISLEILRKMDENNLYGHCNLLPWPHLQSSCLLAACLRHVHADEQGPWASFFWCFSESVERPL
uniref:Pyrin domain-containing protein n=1 Tax=Hucho hucho TaxID=62062 RepID=A0A4W5PQV2_9TELE